MEILDGFGRFDKVYDRAYYAYQELNMDNLCFDKEDATLAYKKFLYHKLKNPTAADIAMNKVYKKNPMYNAELFGKHLFVLEKMPEVDVLVKKVKEIEKGYKNTKYTRRELIARDRITLDSVTPKLKGMNKLLFRLKAMI